MCVCWTERESERVWRADWHTLTHPAFEVVVDIVANGRIVVRLVEKPHDVIPWVGGRQGGRAAGGGKVEKPYDVIPSLEKGKKNQARGWVCVCARVRARVCVRAQARGCVCARARARACVCVCVSVVETAL